MHVRCLRLFLSLASDKSRGAEPTAAVVATNPQGGAVGASGTAQGTAVLVPVAPIAPLVVPVVPIPVPNVPIVVAAGGAVTQCYTGGGPVRSPVAFRSCSPLSPDCSRQSV